MSPTILGVCFLVPGIIVAVAGIIYALYRKVEDDSKKIMRRDVAAVSALLNGGTLAIIGFIICIFQLIRHIIHVIS